MSYDLPEHFPATPRPWKEGPDLTIVDSSGHLIARMNSTRGKYETEDSNRKMILDAVNAEAWPKGDYKGHATLAEMVSGHIEVWRDALKHRLIDSDSADKLYIEHELKALEEIEKACEVEMGL